jgi:uncharacterized protein (DUF1501 family)
MIASLNRRQLLKLGAAVGGAALVSRFSFAAPASGDARLVFVILRGALDGLSAVPPYADPHYANLREALAIGAPGSGGVLALDGQFGLHPSLSFLHEAYGARELLVLHAVATPYRERSHFDGQDVLESGHSLPHASDSGWLNRALNGLPTRAKESGVALGQNVPLVLRGPASIASWSPAVLPQLDEDTLQRITDRYATDPVLGARLAEALATDQIAAESQAVPMQTVASAMAPPQRPSRYLETVRTAANFLKRDDGPSVAVFDTLGWDTHFNEGGAQGQLAQRLGVLDQALRAFKDALGDTWSHTAVLLATEFGRTAAANGTRGTDHGTASAAFLLGGAVAGGRVLADWPGLGPKDLYQGRDLKATLDLRSVQKSVLRDHLKVAPQRLDEQVFPGSGAAPYLDGLLRA